MLMHAGVRASDELVSEVILIWFLRRKFLLLMFMHAGGQMVRSSVWIIGERQTCRAKQRDRKHYD